jgi:hypothetical protein
VEVQTNWTSELGACGLGCYKFAGGLTSGWGLKNSQAVKQVFAGLANITILTTDIIELNILSSYSGRNIKGWTENLWISVEKFRLAIRLWSS